MILIKLIKINFWLIDYLRNFQLIGWTTIIFGILLYFSDLKQINKSVKRDYTFKTAVYIGFFQILALVPGVSRAGITMTAARIFRFNRVDAGKISFLLAIPALTGASILNLNNIFKESIDFNYLILLAIFLSFVFSYFTIKFFLM